MDKGSQEVRDMLADIPELWGSVGPVNLPDAAFDAIARKFTKALAEARAPKTGELSPDASGSYMGTGSAYWNPNLSGR